MVKLVLVTAAAGLDGSKSGRGLGAASHPHSDLTLSVPGFAPSGLGSLSSTPIPATTPRPMFRRGPRDTAELGSRHGRGCLGGVLRPAAAFKLRRFFPRQGETDESQWTQIGNSL